MHYNLHVLLCAEMCTIKKGSLKMEVFLMLHVHSKFLNVMYIHVCVVLELHSTYEAKCY